MLEAEKVYTSKIEIRDLTRGSGTRTNFGHIRSEGIVGEVKNLGDHTVTELDLKFELLDSAGKAVGEKDHSVILPSSTKEPLKPNYTLPFGIAVDNPPSDWVAVRGSVELLQLSREGLRFPEEEKAHATRTK